MKQLLLLLPFLCCIAIPLTTKAQCPADVNYGQNIVVNGDFENGYTGWSFTPQTIPWTGDPPAVQADGYLIHGLTSQPGDIFVGNNPNTQFNAGFQTFSDHTSGSGNYLMVDGVCKLGVKLFTQNVNVVANTNYYFSVWINSLKDNPTNPGVLNFDVGGNNIGANIIAPALGGGSVGGGWKKYEIVWNSGATTGSVAISIENQNTSSCSNQVDFAIDDISFIPGCSYGSPGPQPDLGPDQSLCGKGGSITLNANVPQLATTTVSWSDGTTGTGLSAPYTKVITTAGTYSVCVTDNGSCVKSDVIVISNTFSINIGGPYSFCASSSQTLDAGYTGIGVTYLWSKNGTPLPYPNNGQTYTATSAGTYKVDVTVPGCGTQSSSTTITSSAPITPIDAYYCATSAPASGITLQASGTASAGYTWFTTATGGSSFNTGPSYTITPAIPMGTTSTYTYYVQDNTISTGSVAPTTYSSVNNSNIPTTSNYLQFQPGGDFTINSLQIPFIFYNPFGQFTVTLEVTNADGTSLSPAQTFTSGLSVETPVSDGTTRMFTLPFTGFNISKSWGSTLGLKLISTSFTYQGQIMIGTNGGSYPYTSSIPGVVTIPNSIVGGSANTTGYSFFYNWNISAKTICARTPVRAINNCPQPVTWTAFYLVPQSDNSCKVVWGTANETNNQYFTVERSSDGINFETIGSVDGAGTRDLASNYYYVDYAPLSGTSYYRVTQHDIDGKYTSTVILAYSENNTQVITYPNPFQHGTTLMVTGEETDSYSYTIYSVSGQLMESGTGSFNIPKTIAEGFAKGMYMVTVSTSTNIITTKIVKQ